jgi:heptosyltransferase-3
MRGPCLDVTKSQLMKILLIKLNHIGDTLLMTPTIRFIKDRYPGAEIDVVVRRGCEPVLEGNPDIKSLIPVGSPERAKRPAASSAGEFVDTFKIIFNKKYDYAFDLSNSDRAKLWIFLSRARVRSINQWHAKLGWKRLIFNSLTNFAWGPEHQVLRDFRAVADVIDPSAAPGPLYINTDIDTDSLRLKLPFMEEAGRYAVIHPVSRWGFKEWLPERWAEVADWINTEHKLEVVFSSGPDNAERERISNILKLAGKRHHFTEGKLKLRELAYVARNASLFVGVDTVAMHIAAAVQTPTVALFGPSSEWSWRPWHCPHELVLGDCSCKKTRKFICDKSRPYPCMAGISVESVKGAVARVMS